MFLFLMAATLYHHSFEGYPFLTAVVGAFGTAPHWSSAEESLFRVFVSSFWEHRCAGSRTVERVFSIFGTLGRTSAEFCVSSPQLGGGMAPCARVGSRKWALHPR